MAAAADTMHSNARFIPGNYIVRAVAPVLLRQCSYGRQRLCAVVGCACVPFVTLYGRARAWSRPLAGNDGFRAGVSFHGVQRHARWTAVMAAWKAGPQCHHSFP